MNTSDDNRRIFLKSGAVFLGSAFFAGTFLEAYNTGDKIDAQRKTGNKEYGILESTPGSYVKDECYVCFVKVAEEEGIMLNYGTNLRCMRIMNRTEIFNK